MTDLAKAIEAVLLDVRAHYKHHPTAKTEAHALAHAIADRGLLADWQDDTPMSGRPHFPDHVGLEIAHNPHKLLYQPVEDYVNNAGTYEWLSDADRQQAIAADDLWTIRWYPDTPIGFHQIAAASWDALIDAATTGDTP